MNNHKIHFANSWRRQSVPQSSDDGQRMRYCCKSGGRPEITLGDAEWASNCFCCRLQISVIRNAHRECAEARRLRTFLEHARWAMSTRRRERMRHECRPNPSKLPAHNNTPTRIALSPSNYYISIK